VQSARTISETDNEQPVRAALYTLNGDLALANLTKLADTTIQVPDQEMSLLNIPLQATAPAGKLVVELALPDSAGAGRLFFVGANDGKESAPTYYRSLACGVPEPIAIGDVDGWDPTAVVLELRGRAK
jgi:hypothetical protein